MGGSTGIYWLWWAGSVGVGVVLLAVGLWALYAGRPRGRVCPRCHFDLSGSAARQCPNCGFTAKREKAFRARARHPFLAATCFVLLNVGVVLGLYVQFQATIMSRLPTDVLIQLLPASFGRDSAVGHELYVRIITMKMSKEDQRALAERCIAGDFHGEPISDEWQARYGELLVTLRRYTPIEDTLLEPAYALPMALQVVAREHWPSGAELCVQVGVQDWWPKGTEIRLTATPDVPGVEPTQFVRTGWYMPANRFALFLPAMSDGEHEIAYDFKVERRHIARGGDWQDVGTLRESVHVTISGAMDDVLPPVHDAELDDILAELFSTGIARWEGGISPVRVYFMPEQTFTSKFEGVAIGVSVRVLHDGKVARDMKLWWLGGPQNRSLESWSLGWEVPWEDVETLTTAPGDDGEWSVQVVSLQNVALRVVGATRYWAGDVQMATDVIEREGDAPPVPWREGKD